MELGIWEIVKKSVLLLFTGALLGMLLLAGAYLLPVDEGRRQASIETIEQEGWYPRAAVTAASMDAYFHSFLPDVLDGSTDRIMLYTAMDTSVGHPLQRAMNAHSEYRGDYSYYWHGYVSILRPLLLLFDYSELRVFNGVCQLLILFGLAFHIGREKGAGHVLMLVTSYVLLAPAALSLSLQFSWVFYIAFPGAFLLVRRREYFAEDSRHVYFFIAIGMLTSYFDLLTYPLFTWGIPLLWWLVMGEEQERAVFWVRRVVTSGFGWIAGYAGMWIMKWALGTIILGRNLFDEAVYEVFFRVGIREEGNFGLEERLDAVYSNWKHYEYKVYALILAGWFLWWLCGTLRRGWKRNPRRYAWFLTGISSIVWYTALAGHTKEHHFFAYRIFGVSILAFLAMILDSVPGRENAVPGLGAKDAEGSGGAIRHVMPARRPAWLYPPQWYSGRRPSRRQSAQQKPKSGCSEGGLGKEASGRRRLEMCCAWAGAVMLAIPCTLLAREEQLSINGSEEFRIIQMSSDGGLETEFTPAFDEIQELGLGLECDGTEGQYEITLWEGDVPKYQSILSIADCAGGNYQNVRVSWKLDRGTAYRLTVQVQGSDAPVSVWVTEGGAAPLAEYTELKIDNAAVEGQILSGIDYRRLPASGRTLLFLAMTWTGIWMAVIYVFLPERALYCRPPGFTV